MHRFIVAHSANALSMGVQLVLVAWLAAGVLQLPASQVGWVQAALLSPALLLMLVSGALVDRYSPSRILVLANTGLLFAHGLAIVVLLNDWLNLATLAFYALCLGIANTFVQTAREKLVAQMAEGYLQRVISIALVCQFAAQGVGVALASLTDIVGPTIFVSLQALICAVALLVYRTLVQPAAPLSNPPRVHHAIGDGIRQAWQQVPVRHILLIVGFNGFMHLGVFIVILPLIARDVMGFGSVEYGMLQLAFIVGNVLTHFIILKRAQVRYPGQGVLFSLLYAGVIGLALSAQPTVAGLFVLVFLWGCVAGNSTNLSRVVVQTLVAATHRGRVMALYQLALLGMAPLGALFAGYVVQHTTVWLVFQVVGISSIALFFLSLLSRGLWGMRAEDIELGDGEGLPSSKNRSKR